MKLNKPPVPDLSDERQVYTKKELKEFPFPRVKISCCVNDCSGYVSVKDIGQHPMYAHRTKTIDLNRTIFFCSRHWKVFKEKKKAGLNYWPLAGYRLGTAIDHIKTNQ